MLSSIPFRSLLTSCVDRIENRLSSVGSNEEPGKEVMIVNECCPGADQLAVLLKKNRRQGVWFKAT